MLSVEECKKYLQGIEMTDEGIEKLRESLYRIVVEILDSLYENKTNATI